MKRFIPIAFVLLAVAGFIKYFPAKIPYSIKGPGMILPYREWVLSGCNEGQLTATLRDNIAGTGEVSFFTQFIRGDAVRFRLHPSVQPGFYINKGDTIGWIESRETELQLV
ncbi:MAG TPA: hypothetical protein VMZ04_10990, partial [Anaerolineae bacterium]|nr:hypothetical protein [Anaerolineae bacterium]